jgi:hypothetical protein
MLVWRAMPQPFRDGLNVSWSFPLPSHSQDALLWDQIHGDYWERHGVPKPHGTEIDARTDHKGALGPPSRRRCGGVLARASSHKVRALARRLRNVTAHSTLQARIDRPVDKRRASRPLPPAAFIHSSGIPALRRPSYARSFNSTRAGLPPCAEK